MILKKKNTLISLAVLAAFSMPAFADPPPWAGGKSEKHEKKHDKYEKKYDKHEYKEKGEKYKAAKRHDHDDDDHDYRGDRVYRDQQHTYVDQYGNRIVVNDYFRNEHRNLIHDYYSREYRNGNCPPGLAKKNNGCMPPGLAKKWHIGQPLPSNIQYQPLPPVIVTQLGQPPAGYQYVRVDNDILLLATGTRLVIDAIRNLGF